MRSVLQIARIDLEHDFWPIIGIEASGTNCLCSGLGVEGQLTTIDPCDTENPCYACLIPDVPEVEPTCAETGYPRTCGGYLGYAAGGRSIGCFAGLVLTAWLDD